MKTGFAPAFPLITLVLLLLASFTGCATTDQRLDFNYAPGNSTLGRQDGSISVSRNDTGAFTRNNRGEWIVGALNNVHGVHEADLVSDNNQGDWLSEALILELKRTGFTVTGKPPAPPAAGIGIQLNDIKASMNVNSGIFSSDIKQELTFSVDFFNNGSKVKTFTVAARAGQTVLFRASSTETTAILTQTVQDALHQVLSELRSQLGKR